MFIIMIALASVQNKAALADVDDFYTQLKSMKNPSPDQINQLKQKTAFTDQIKKMNDVSAQNKEAAASAAKTKKNKKPNELTENSTDSEVAVPKPSKNSGSKSRATNTATTSSAPIKVNDDGPDELNFSGDEELAAPKKK